MRALDGLVARPGDRRPRPIGAGFAAVASLILALAGCAPVDFVNATVPTHGLAITRDIPYGPESRQRLDLYHPAGLKCDAPAVVFFYGGAWQTGERADYLFAAQEIGRAHV